MLLQQLAQAASWWPVTGSADYDDSSVMDSVLHDLLFEPRYHYCVLPLRPPIVVGGVNDDLLAVNVFEIDRLVPRNRSQRLKRHIARIIAAAGSHKAPSGPRFWVILLAVPAAQR